MKRSMVTSKQASPFSSYRFPAEIIAHVVWLYFRFPLSLRMVDEMLAARGIVVSHETVRQWALKFGRLFARALRRRQPKAGDKWHLDELMIAIKGQKYRLWRAVDQHGIVLDILIQSRRDKKAAKRLMRKLCEEAGLPASDADHRQAEELWRSEARDHAGGQAPPAQGSEQPSREFPPSDPKTRTDHAAVQIAQIGPAISVRS